MEFTYPLAALRGIEPLMGARVHDELKISDPAWRERLGRQVNHVRFPSRSILARPSLSLSQLMQLEPGDVIPVQINRSLPLLVGTRVFRSEEHTSELQSLMRISYAVFCLNKKN